MMGDSLKLGLDPGSNTMKKMVLGAMLLLTINAQPVLAEEIRTFPAGMYAQMKKGVKIDGVWMSPKFDGSKGFVIGKVDIAVDGPFANVIDYFPTALRRLAIPDSPNVLNLTVVELNTVDRPAAGYCSATMGVEGQVVDPDGQVLFAFRTREEINTRETIIRNCQAIMDDITWKLSKNLGKPYLHALTVKNELVTGHNPSGLVPPGPPAPLVDSGDIKGRLLRLEELRQKGLITPEEYKAHKEEIMKGL
jgi:hypothetical protein